MKKPGRSDRTEPILTLLLLLLAVGWTGAIAGVPAGDSPACDPPLYLEAAGDVPWPGVFSFCRQPVTPAVLLHRAGADPRIQFKAADFDARPLASGTRVVFQIRDGEPRMLRKPMSAFTRLTLGMPVPVNRVSTEELTALPGVGPSLARSIVEQRDRMNGFEGKADLLAVHGIGPRTLERLRPLVCIP